MAKYEEWIRALAAYQGGRAFYRDQTVASLETLANLIKAHDPETVIELGTAHGLSTRLWLQEVGPDVPIVCFDASFEPLRGTASVLPVDMERLTLVEGWVNKARLQDYFHGRTLLYVDIHSDHQHVLDAVPDLPKNSIVIFDDVWRSNKKLVTDEEKEEFLRTVVEPEIDFTAPRSIWPLCYADYWRRGGFWGFPEVPLIMEWVAERKINLHWEKGAKLVWFTT